MRTREPNANHLNTLSREERLRGNSRIQQLFESGTAGFVYPFRYIWRESPTQEGIVSVMFSVGKKYHKRANRRNLLKRRMREAYRTGKHGLACRVIPCNKRIDIALMYCTKEILDSNTVGHAITEILGKIEKNI